MIPTLFSHVVHQLQPRLPSAGDPVAEHRPAASQQRQQRPVLLAKAGQGGGGGPTGFLGLPGLHPAAAAAQPRPPHRPAVARVAGRQPQVPPHSRGAGGPGAGPQLVHGAAEDHHPLPTGHTAQPAALQQRWIWGWTRRVLLGPSSVIMRWQCYKCLDIPPPPPPWVWPVAGTRHPA